MARSLSIFQTDHQSSVIASITEGVQEAIQFTPFGYTKPAEASPAIRYTGQLWEKGLGWYMLGNGHRGYNPVLRRFHSADSLSPFDRGGINAYAYVLNNPVNLIDPDGKNGLKYAVAGIGIAKGAVAGGHYLYKLLKDLSASNPLMVYTVAGYALKFGGEVITTAVETIKINQSTMAPYRASAHDDPSNNDFALSVAYATGKIAGLVGEGLLVGVSAAAHFGGGTNAKAKSAEQGEVNRSLLDNPPPDTAPPRPTSLHLTSDSPSPSPSLRGKPSTRGRGRGRGSRTSGQMMSSIRTE